MPQFLSPLLLFKESHPLTSRDSKQSRLKAHETFTSISTLPPHLSISQMRRLRYRGRGKGLLESHGFHLVAEPRASPQIPNHCSFPSNSSPALLPDLSLSSEAIQDMSPPRASPILSPQVLWQWHPGPNDLGLSAGFPHWGPCHVL